MGSEDQVCVSSLFLHYFRPGGTAVRGNHSRGKLAGFPRRPGPSLSCSIKAGRGVQLLPSRRIPLLLNRRHRELNLFCVCVPRERRVWANIHAGVLHTLRDIHSFVPQTLAPTAPICAVLYKVGVRGLAKTRCNLGASRQRQDSGI